jgi:hypothetical protein
MVRYISESPFAVNEAICLPVTAQQLLKIGILAPSPGQPLYGSLLSQWPLVLCYLNDGLLLVRPR